jgi:acetyltransferase-like isoleucine patch superfamily enzyme
MSTSVPLRQRPPSLRVRARKVAVGVWLARHCETPAWRLPIFGTWRARIYRRPGATIRIGRRLHLGDAPTVLGNVSRGMAPVIELQEDATLHIVGKSLMGDGTKVLIGPGGTVTIGDGTFFDGDSRLICFESVTIGAGCAIAWEVTIMDAGWHRMSHQASANAPVVVGDRVWIGAGVSILPGVTVGDGAVIATGAVVTSDVPARSLVAGVPAHVIRDDVEWHENSVPDDLPPSGALEPDDAFPSGPVRASRGRFARDGHAVDADVP